MDQGFYDHFCHYEQYPNQPDPTKWVDLSRDPCGPQVAALVLEALAQEVESPGSGDETLASLSATCPQWSSFLGQRCVGSSEPLSCLGSRVRDLAQFLTIPYGHQEYLRKLLTAPGVRLDF